MHQRELWRRYIEVSVVSATRDFSTKPVINWAGAEHPADADRVLA